jgi:hypothetical protein
MAMDVSRIVHRLYHLTRRRAGVRQLGSNSRRDDFSAGWFFL